MFSERSSKRHQHGRRGFAKLAMAAEIHSCGEGAQSLHFEVGRLLPAFRACEWAGAECLDA
jgi:hypothetical protein